MTIEDVKKRFMLSDEELKNVDTSNIRKTMQANLKRLNNCEYSETRREILENNRHLAYLLEQKERGKNK